MLALQAKMIFGLRKTNAIKAFMIIPLIRLCICLYLLALRRVYFGVSDYLKNYGKQIPDLNRFSMGRYYHIRRRQQVSCTALITGKKCDIRSDF